MTRATNARLAGFAFLFYIAVGITSMVIFGRASSGKGIAAKLASIGQHATEIRVYTLLILLTSFSALVLGVTLYALTRDEDRDIALIAMFCRLVEAVNNAASIDGTQGLVWLATATGSNALDSSTAQALAAFQLRGSPSISAIFFAVGSTLFCWLFLRGRLIPVALAWLGVIASVLLVVALPLDVGGASFGGLVSWLIWMPMLAFELWLAFWLIIKGVAGGEGDGALHRPRLSHVS